MDEIAATTNPREFEIGVVYRKNNRLYLAISEHKLLCLQHGQEVIKPYEPRSYGVVRHITVDELCKRWGVEIEQLDNAIYKLGLLNLTPEQKSPRTNPKGARRKRHDSEDLVRVRIRVN